VIPPDEIRTSPGRFIGREVRRFGTIPSTNDLAIASDVPDGTALVADHQSNGRGQHGRVWTSRPGDSLLVSLRLRPPPELARPVILTALAAVAVGDAIRELAGAQARIKWPNDLLIHGKKICGILIEAGRATVIGIGLNLNQSAEEFANAGLPDATSLQRVGGRRVDRDAALDSVLSHLDREWARLLAGERVPLESDWKWRIGLLGRTVLVERSDGIVISGRLLEMGFDAIELLQDDGTAEAIQPELVRHIHAAETETSADQRGR
jgi:BirA family transcriptional regulator, biotin operon repressor / biotin---[acetyl-CoA-carboxylase] ligase